MERIVELQHARLRAKEAGFTLVELAIVLVIIGLIIGGVLVGQDLIRAAELRNVSSDIEKYNAAANTFRNKYNGLPGDLLSNRATNFGMSTGTARDGTAGMGDGNGVVEGCDQSETALGCESALFWVDLTVAQLISDAFTVGAGATDGLDVAADTTANSLATVADVSRFLPSLALRESAFVHIFPQGGRNYFYLGALNTTAAGLVQTVGPQPVGALNEVDGLAGITPAEAAQLDDKVDDGAPTTGILRATHVITDANGATDNPGAAPATGVCVDDGAAPAIENDETYNTADTNFANELNCNIYWRSSF